MYIKISISLTAWFCNLDKTWAICLQQKSQPFVNDIHVNDKTPTKFSYGQFKKGFLGKCWTTR